MIVIKLEPNQYQCEICRGVFTKTKTDEEAIAEAVEKFGEMGADPDSAWVCDNCYQLIDPAKHPEIVAAAKREYEEKQKGLSDES